MALAATKFSKVKREKKKEKCSRKKHIITFAKGHVTISCHCGFNHKAEDLESANKALGEHRGNSS